MNWDVVDWDVVDRLRAGFLEGTAGKNDYWRSESDLATYDETFAQRIAWKWDYVLAELVRRHWAPPEGQVLDWGCGTGMAGRTYLKHFASPAPAGLTLSDRSRLAVKFATQRTRQAFPEVQIRSPGEAGKPADLLLISHVLTELTDRQLDELLAQVQSATAVIWVEPGTHQIGRLLIDIRERLRSQFQVVAPCTHQAACGMLAPENDRHWCHHFVPADPQVFTDGNWVRFGHLAGIDLRSLPVSFLVLDKRPAPALPAEAVRVIGRPRVYKAYALLFGCDSASTRDRRLMKRHFPDEFRRLKKGDLDPLQLWQCDGTDITAQSTVNG